MSRQFYKVNAAYANVPATWIDRHIELLYRDAYGAELRCIELADTCILLAKDLARMETKGDLTPIHVLNLLLKPCPSCSSATSTSFCSSCTAMNARLKTVIKSMSQVSTPTPAPPMREFYKVNRAYAKIPAAWEGRHIELIFQSAYGVELHCIELSANHNISQAALQHMQMFNKLKRIAAVSMVLKRCTACLTSSSLCSGCAVMEARLKTLIRSMTQQPKQQAPRWNGSNYSKHHPLSRGPIKNASGGTSGQSGSVSPNQAAYPTYNPTTVPIKSISSSSSSSSSSSGSSGSSYVPGTVFYINKHGTDLPKGTKVVLDKSEKAKSLYHATVTTDQDIKMTITYETVDYWVSTGIMSPQARGITPDVFNHQNTKYVKDALYNTYCKKCGAPAFIGMLFIECSKGCQA